MKERKDDSNNSVFRDYFQTKEAGKKPKNFGVVSIIINKSWFGLIFSKTWQLYPLREQ